MKEMEFETYTLPNSIRLIHRYVDSPVAHCGVIINTGSREEKDGEHGMAHFIEHVIFKGTKKRKAYHVLSRMEDVGGELNAYTTKEETCFYASFLKDDFKRAVELLSDIIFNSIFPEKELKKEKEVILDEINSYKDNPSELIFDDFEELIFKDHSIARNILGDPKKLKKFKKDDVLRFMKENYHTDQIVFCSVGNIRFDKVKNWVDGYFGSVPANIRKIGRISLPPYFSQTLKVKKDTFQTHCIIGNVAYSLYDDRRIALHLLNNILGGPGMNSRLNMSLREKNGFAYNIESHFNSYTDTGAFCVYFGTDPGKLDKSLQLIKKEFSNVMTRKLGTLQIHKAKRQLIGQLAISADSNENVLLTIGKSHLIYNKVDSLEEMNNKIQSISSFDLLEVANDILADEKLSMLLFE
jgi:predicted Zn-dependent peptidase